MSEVIPTEATEAAADMIGSLRLGDRQKFLTEAQLILEAAAPHMLAGAWDEGWDTFAGFDSRPGGPYPANPYRPTSAD